jgi:hypothetical protein
MGSAWMRAFADMMRSAAISEIHAVLMPAGGMLAALSPQEFGTSRQWQLSVFYTRSVCV